ncbi:MAG: aldose epimerase [Planctomycetota bacterium]
MARFAVQRKSFGRFETLRLVDTATAAEAAFALFGATLLSYRIPHKGRLLDVTDGFQTPEELESGRGGRAWIMAPFSNRVEGARYVFEGEAHQMPVTDPARNAILHGFVHGVTFDVPDEHADDDSARALFATSALRPGAFPGYPFAVDVTVTVGLSDAGLSLEIAGKNVGDRNAPFGCGWHPYFRTSEEGIDRLRLSIPCTQRIELDPFYIPLEGRAAYAPVESAPELDFRPRRPGDGNVIGGRKLDTAFAGLVPDPDGWIRTVLEDPENGLRISVLQERGLLHAFTGDTLAARPRRAIALEPVAFLTNAFNRPDCQAALTLAPGRSASFRFGVETGSPRDIGGKG